MKIIHIKELTMHIYIHTQNVKYMTVPCQKRQYIIQKYIYIYVTAYP